jgi:hypothetical protein
MIFLEIGHDPGSRNGSRRIAIMLLFQSSVYLLVCLPFYCRADQSGDEHGRLHGACSPVRARSVVRELAKLSREVLAL